MIYIIDHNDSFTHNVVHQLSLYDKVECDNYNEINKNKLEKASVIIFSPGPGNPKNYPLKIDYDQENIKELESDNKNSNESVPKQLKPRSRQKKT